MSDQKNFFTYFPGGESEGSGFASGVNENDETNSLSANSENKEQPSLLKKIKDALQDWSNDDQREQQIDDSRP